MLDNVKGALALLDEIVLVIVGFAIVILLWLPALALIWYGQPVLGVLWIGAMFVIIPLLHGN